MMLLSEIKDIKSPQTTDQIGYSRALGVLSIWHVCIGIHPGERPVGISLDVAGVVMDLRLIGG